MKIRGFEKIKKEQFEKDFKDYSQSNYDDIMLPRRGTKRSAGYDFYSPVSFILKPNEILKIPTGLKAYMQDNEYLALIIRSSVGFKYNVRPCNQIGIIDADYYSNINNDGHMWVAIQNEGKEDYIVKKGDRVVQGIFCNYLLTDNDEVENDERIGGIGSTNKEVI
jgi:dUTP pyrophosphatase